MKKIKSLYYGLSHLPKPLFMALVFCIIFIQPARADLVDSLDLSRFIPLVLESMMNIATSLYGFFVGNGTGLIYILVYGFLAFYIGLYLVKMYLPKDWLSFLGFSGGGEMWAGPVSGWNIAENVLKPSLRAIIAIVVLLQIKPTYVTEWLVNPFLEFGAIYTQGIMKINTGTVTVSSDAPTCPASIKTSEWISENSCDFLIQPVHTISKENNRIIKYGFDFLKSGLRGMLTLIPHRGENILNVITGLLLISAFVASNIFIALLIIQAIFDFCLSLIMYPFSVLAWVVKKSDKWFDIFPPFSQIIDSLKKLVITMIACAFILCINIAVVRALFNWSSSAFVVAAGGVASSNVPTLTNGGMNFGQHSMLWISSILTFFVMKNIFDLTRERLDLYTNGGSKKPWLYNNVTNDAKTLWGHVKSSPDTVKNIIGGVKKVIGKK